MLVDGEKMGVIVFLKEKECYILILSQKVFPLGFLRGGLAQLARALAWQARGHRFDSGILHQVNTGLH